ncbi:MmgE/PrpD family protein [Rahnella sp. Lac-M11]|uniref:MmgE/PrpD family protein n=1 Tax=Rahnella contaminans TaxID=2703882 RepID=A0A6M2AYR8_9GAMM|nr:MmgE/PrpD family protein [Rahnella contaminans]NGX86086.1 MmgE/PrpD family protein [Rahnella contaminans]
MSKLSQQQILSEFVVNIHFDDLPPRLVERTKRHILDTIGAGLVGATSDVAKDVAAMILGEGALPLSPVWGYRELTSARNAALLNGVAAHALELDDTGGCDHSGAVVIPAVLAVLPLCPQPVSGKAFITAVVMGYDVARRVLEACGGYSPHNRAGWHSTSTCGVFGAAAAAGKILGLSAGQISSALGISGSFSGGLWAFIHDGSQSKKLHAGRAAEGGVLAALSARQGIIGPAQLFEDQWGGFLSTLAPQSAMPEMLTASLGEIWKLERCSIKPYASCRGTHSAIDATGILLEEMHATAGDIEKIVVRLCPFLNGMCGDNEIATLAAAQMSLRYAIAARVVFGHAGLDAYGTAQRQDPDLLAMIARIVLTEDATMSSDSEPDVTVFIRTGESKTLRVDVALGSPGNPVSDEQLKEKFVSLATRVISVAGAERIWNSGMEMENLPDVQGVFGR